MTDPIAAGTPLAALTLASSPAPLRKTSSSSSVDVAALARDIETAQSQAEALARQLRDGAKANAAAAKASRLDLARARLKALRLMATLKAALGDGRGALKVAEEAARVAREVEGLRTTRATAGADAAAGQATTVAAATEAAADPAVDDVLQTARKVIALARRAARPGSVEDRAMESLQRSTGVPQIAADVGGDGDRTRAAADVVGMNLEV